MDGVERFLVQNSEGTGGESANEEGTEQAGSVGDGDGVDFVPVEAGVFERLINDGENSFNVRTGGDFGDDTTVGLVDVNLRNDDVA